MAPSRTHGPTCSPAVTRFQVHAEVARTQISRIAVLLTVPCSVMGSVPTLGSPVNVFEFKAGFALRSVAMKSSPRFLMLGHYFLHRRHGSIHSAPQLYRVKFLTDPRLTVQEH